MKRTALVGLAMAVLLSTASAQTKAISNDLDDVIAAAKKEGKIDLVWSESIMGGIDEVQKHEAAFNKLYGSNIKFVFAPGVAMAQFGNQLLSEMRAGQPASSDIYISAAAQTLPLLQEDMFQQVPWHKLRPERITENDVEEDSKALRFQTALSGITYNTNLIKTPPPTLAGFLAPEWKGKLASTPYAAGFDILAADTFWGPEKTLDFVRKLSPQLSGLIRCGDVERIATGEFAALVMDCVSNSTLEWQKRGAPVAYAIPTDGAQKRYYYLSIPKHAAHPNAAALFTIYLMSKEGQRLMWDTLHADLDSLEGSHTAEVIAGYEKKGVKFPDVTIDWWSKHPEVDKTKAEMIKVLSRK
jgi:ABC-type Fe3+ transport system substrate-binding protein